MNARRWFSGDTHVHFLSTQGSHTEAQGEDLNVVNLLLSQWGHLFTNTEEFTGGPRVSRGGRAVGYASPEKPQHPLRHFTLLGRSKTLIPKGGRGVFRLSLIPTGNPLPMARWDGVV